MRAMYLLVSIELDVPASRVSKISKRDKEPYQYFKGSTKILVFLN